MPLEDHYRPGFTPPADVHELLTRARDIIRDEKRWLQGSYVARNYDIKDEAPACTNVRVCARGAIYVARFDGLAVDYYVHGINTKVDGKLYSETFGIEESDPMTRAAVRFVDQATRDLTEGRYVDVIDLNDEDLGDYYSESAYEEKRRAHLNRVIAVFDKAIEEAAATAAV